MKEKIIKQCKAHLHTILYNHAWSQRKFHLQQTRLLACSTPVERDSNSSKSHNIAILCHCQRNILLGVYNIFYELRAEMELCKHRTACLTFTWAGNLSLELKWLSHLMDNLILVSRPSIPQTYRLLRSMYEFNSKVPDAEVSGICSITSRAWYDHTEKNC